MRYEGKAMAWLQWVIRVRAHLKLGLQVFGFWLRARHWRGRHVDWGGHCDDKC